MALRCLYPRRASASALSVVAERTSIVKDESERGVQREMKCGNNEERARGKAEEEVMAKG